MIPPELYCAVLFDQMPPCDPSAPPQATQVMLNSDLLRIAGELGMDLSVACERALTEQVRVALYQRWRQCTDDASGEIGGPEQPGETIPRQKLCR